MPCHQLADLKQIRVAVDNYLVAAVALNVVFIGYAWALWRAYSDRLARKTFRYSIWYLSLLFAALLLDHYLAPILRGTA